jgi:hypothetical protein
MKMLSDEDTKGQAGPPSQMQVPGLSLPKGGGAIQGIGEKFSSNGMTGTSSRPGRRGQTMLGIEQNNLHYICEFDIPARLGV